MKKKKKETAGAVPSWSPHDVEPAQISNITKLGKDQKWEQSIR